MRNHSSQGYRHQAGHTLGDAPKKTSIGHGRRKRGSFKGRKKYRGQGRS